MCNRNRDVRYVLPTSVLFALALSIAAMVPAVGQPVNRAGEQAAQHQVSIVGDWQGTLEFPASGSRAGARYRLILRVAASADGGLSALNYSIDQGPAPMRTADVSLQGNTFRFSIPALNGSYEGQLGADRASIEGIWTQGRALPLNFVRATKETAWEIPAPPPPVRPMAADVDPSFAVATIKPSNSGASSGQTKIIRVMGRQYVTQSTSLADLIEVAYGVHARQITGAPEWVFEDKFDLVAVPAEEGQPSGKQWLTMVQKLLAERFRLAFHHDRKEISVYVLSVAKDGVKGLEKSESANPFPSGLEFVPSAAGLTLPAQNATLGQLCQMMQQVVLDRPVVDQTGVEGKFNFHFTFTPDDSQFNGHPPRVPAASDGTNTSPGLFEALRQQLGLNLAAEKKLVDVLAIDRAEKPSAN